MSAQDNLGPQFFHGTRADFNVGDLVTPGHASNFDSHAKATHVYLTESLNMAAWAADSAQGAGPGRIYKVEPTGRIMDDPQLVSESGTNPTKSFRSRKPLRVLGEHKG